MFRSDIYEVKMHKKQISNQENGVKLHTCTFIFFLTLIPFTYLTFLNNYAPSLRFLQGTICLLLSCDLVF